MSRRISQRDKFLLFDVGVRNAILGVHRRPVTQDQMGTVFEQWLVLQCIYLNRSLRKGWTFSAYRTESGAEVDLVVERDDDIVGIEIKAGRNVSGSNCRGLFSLSETIGRYKPLQKWVVYRGNTRQLLAGNVWVYPYLEALSVLFGLSGEE